MSNLIAEHLARRGAHPSRIAIDGRWHTVIDLTAMEGIGYEHQGSIEFPPPGERGWATTRVGSHRFAAWFEPAPLEAMTAAAADRILGGDDA